MENKETIKIKLKKKIQLHYEMELLTGLHIGAGKDIVEIGGIDLPVVRTPLKNNQPYIPGSSLKGKLRSLLEYKYGCSKVGESVAVNKIFGITENKNKNRVAERCRIIVRDAYLTEESVKKLEEAELPMPFTEVKFENTINRLTGTAEHPRQLERIPAGAKFDVFFVINVFEGDNEEEIKNRLDKAISLLEGDYLGGSGTRGYGQVAFQKIEEKPIFKNPENE